MQKNFKQILILTSLLFIFSYSTALANDWAIEINGQPIDAEVKIIDGRSLVPLRTIGEALGLAVEWNSNTQEIVLDGSALLDHEKQSDIVKLNCQNDVYDAFINNNDNRYKIDTAVFKEEDGILKMLVSPVNIDGRVYIPVRLVCDSFGAPVTVTNNTISIGSCFTAEDATLDKVSQLIYSERQLAESLTETEIYVLSVTRKAINAIEESLEWMDTEEGVLSIAHYVQQECLTIRQDLEDAINICLACNETKELRYYLQKALDIFNEIPTDTITNANCEEILTKSLDILMLGGYIEHLETEAQIFANLSEQLSRFYV